MVVEWNRALPAELQPGETCLVKGLPEEFTGIRLPAEARQDLIGIASNGPAWNRAWVQVDPDEGARAEWSGVVTVASEDGGLLRVDVGGMRAFEFDESACRGAWLETIDGADLWWLRIDLGWGCVELEGQ